MLADDIDNKLAYNNCKQLNAKNRKTKFKKSSFFNMIVIKL